MEVGAKHMALAQAMRDAGVMQAGAGLQPVATATTIAPAFHGVVVLELANTGTVPLELVPGRAIAQLVLQVMTNPVPEELLYRGKYYCQIKP